MLLVRFDSAKLVVVLVWRRERRWWFVCNILLDRDFPIFTLYFTKKRGEREEEGGGKPCFIILYYWRN